ncbi:uncharacterized protein LOC131004556 [Salvia miltiorrhiza]|uniref:uncharacterized protein LOC131004556 n=1 Tax=Salvia miltiorrhiza TaxID=226208 RepID=UPI0025AC65CA|nr:uncharacterized protein LOC131004556 [Salvia miltiorrhiza]
MIVDAAGWDFLTLLQKYTVEFRRAGSLRAPAAAEPPAANHDLSSSNFTSTDSELSSYEAACCSDPDLQNFDSKLQIRTSRAINSISVVLDVRSLPLDSLREVTEYLLEMNQEVVTITLQNKRDIWKDDEFSDLVVFENCLLTLDFCTTLDSCLKRAARIESIVKVALRKFDDDRANAGRNYSRCQTLIFTPFSHLKFYKAFPKPSLLKDYLMDDMSSCSSNGFKSFPRRQCCPSTVRFLVEIDLNQQKKYFIRNISTKSAASAFHRFIAAVKRLPFGSSSEKKPILPRNLSRKIIRKSIFWKRKSSYKEIQRLKSFDDDRANAGRNYSRTLALMMERLQAKKQNLDRKLGKLQAWRKVSSLTADERTEADFLIEASRWWWLCGAAAAIAGD